jgi:hypothetical protein
MKKIILTETQLKKLTNNIVLEQQTNLGGFPVSLDLNGDVNTNPNYGTLTFKIGNKQIKVRLFTTRYGNVNIVKLIPKKDGAFIKTLKGREQILDSDMVSKMIDFIKNPDASDVKLDSSLLIGDLKAKKL